MAFYYSKHFERIFDIQTGPFSRLVGHTPLSSIQVVSEITKCNSVKKNDNKDFFVNTYANRRNLLR